MRANNNNNYYMILGVPRTATQNQIDKAYCKLSLEWHPVNHPDDKELAERKFRNIAEAYSILSDKVKRANYDKQLDKHAESEEDEFSFRSADRLFKKFFKEMHPFRGFDDFFDDDFFNIRRKRPLELLDKEFFNDKTEPSNEEMEDLKEKGDEKCIRHQTSTTSSTVIKNGERKTKTKKTVIGPDGNKKVKLIEEYEDKDGHVKRSVKCLENGREVKEKQKAITSKRDKKSNSLTRMEK